MIYRLLSIYHGAHGCWNLEIVDSCLYCKMLHVYTKYHMCPHAYFWNLIWSIYQSSIIFWYIYLPCKVAHNNIHHVVAWSDTGPNKQAKLMIMFEDWVNSNENWQSSSLLVRQRTSHSSKQVGGRRWFTWKQLADKYQSEEVANEIVAVKESDNKDQIRLHPELPDRKDLRLFLCYDESYETDVTDHVVESLFEVEDKSKDKKKGKKEKKGKKRSSSSQSDSESKLNPVQILRAQVVLRSRGQRMGKRPRKTTRRRKRARRTRRTLNVMQKRSVRREKRKTRRERRNRSVKLKNRWTKREVTEGRAAICVDVIMVCFVSLKMHAWPGS